VWKDIPPLKLATVLNQT